MKFIICGLAGCALGFIAGLLADSAIVSFVVSFAATYGLCQVPPTQPTKEQNMDEQMRDSVEPVGWLIEFKNDIGETITRFYTHNAIGDYRASVDANATSTPLYKRAALSQPVAVWQPIETALKDGSTVIIGGADCGTGEGFWNDGSECYGHRGGAGWFWESDRNGLLTASNAHPTHWMPLPTAPKEQA